MGRPIFTGQKAPVQQPLRVSYDPQHGLQIQIPFESIGNNLADLAYSLQQGRVAYELVPNGRKSTLIASASGGQLGIPDLSTDTWQILANEIQKNGTENPFALRDVAASDLEEIIESLANRIKPSDTDFDGAALKLYDLMYRGSEHYAFSQYVVRHTTNVSNQYGANIADVNVNCLYTTPQLISELTNSNLWTFPLPGRLVYKLQNIPVPPAHDDYLWSWRKLGSNETNTAGNRTEITTEYWLEQWSTFYYLTAA